MIDVGGQRSDQMDSLFLQRKHSDILCITQLIQH